MTIDPDEAALSLERARLERTPVPMLSRSSPLTMEDAYRVQEAGIRLRVGAGEQVIGAKLGFTSRAMQQAMGVPHPNYGVLTDAMWLHGSDVELDRLIHPKVEPEIGFLFASDLTPPISVAGVLAATLAVLPCLEVVDSRYVGFRFTGVDNIADNSSAGMVAFGDPVAYRDRLDLVGVAVWGDGELRSTATGAAALDHPAAAVAWMVNHAPFTVRAGDIVISGGLTGPIDLGVGTVVTAEFDRIGAVSIRAG